jgi:hypothetical protein
LWRGCVALSSVNVWAVGEGEVIAHWDGANWGVGPCPTRTSLHGVWGIDGHYFAVGDQGAFAELEAGEWISSYPSTHQLNAIWGGAPNDVWAVGQETVHWDGSGWFAVPDPAEFELNGVWGSRANDVWAAGRTGTLLHFDGPRWNRAPSPRWPSAGLPNTSQPSQPKRSPAANRSIIPRIVSRAVRNRTRISSGEIEGSLLAGSGMGQ